MSGRDDLVLTTNQEHVVEVQGGKRSRDRASSQEHIIDGKGHPTHSSDIDMDDMDPHRIGISKIVAFEVHISGESTR